MFDDDNREDDFLNEAITKVLFGNSFDDLFNDAKKQITQKNQGHSEYIGDSRQRWSDVENGHHRDGRGRLIRTNQIDKRYAQNMHQWYLSKIDMTHSEKERLEDSQLFQILNDKLGIKMTSNDTNKNRKGEMITMTSEKNVAIIRSIVTNTTESTLVGDSKAKVGDIVLTKEGSEGKFGSFNIGRVETIQMTDQARRGISKITKVVTDVSEDFKALSDELRKKAIKAEIEERMKEVDERQRMMMYAKEDKGIKELLSELDRLD